MQFACLCTIQSVFTVDNSDPLEIHRKILISSADKLPTKARMHALNSVKGHQFVLFLCGSYYYKVKL